MKINYFKYFMIIGLILIVTSLIFNPFVIEKIYDKEKYKYEDNAFNKQNLKNHTIIINAFLIPGHIHKSHHNNRYILRLTGLSA